MKYVFYALVWVVLFACILFTGIVYLAGFIWHLHHNGAEKAADGWVCIAVAPLMDYLD